MGKVQSNLGNCLVTILAPLVVLLVEILYLVSIWFFSRSRGFDKRGGRISRSISAVNCSFPSLPFVLLLCLTFGKLTFGMITLCNADGASFGAFAGFPPGWYWYLKSPPAPSVCHGLEWAATATWASEVEEVGLRPGSYRLVHARFVVFVGSLGRRLDCWSGEEWWGHNIPK